MGRSVVLRSNAKLGAPGDGPLKPYGNLSRLLLTLALACTPNSQSPLERAEFGVLFGGQVQERTEIPFELDTTKQALGFVITLNQPLTKPTVLHWEVSKPGPPSASRLSDPINRRVELFDATVAPGQTH